MKKEGKFSCLFGQCYFYGPDIYKPLEIILIRDVLNEFISFYILWFVLLILSYNIYYWTKNKVQNYKYLTFEGISCLSPDLSLTILPMLPGELFTKWILSKRNWNFCEIIHITFFLRKIYIVFFEKINHENKF